jgi:hypothetical protein
LNRLQARLPCNPAAPRTHKRKPMHAPPAGFKARLFQAPTGRPTTAQGSALGIRL